MPIRDDLILRMLDQIGDVAALVLTGRTPSTLQDAERDLATAYRELTGSGRELVARLSSEQLLAILGAPTRFNRERGYLLARLLEIDATLRDARVEAEGPDEAGTSLPSSAGDRLKALDLYLEAAHAGLDEEDLDERIGGLERRLGPTTLPEATHWRRFEHAAERGRFAAAEDLLFHGIERFGAAGEAATRGRAFYRDLQAHSDGELEAGGLPRDEVAEGLEAFETAIVSVGAGPA